MKLLPRLIPFSSRLAFEFPIRMLCLFALLAMPTAKLCGEASHPDEKPAARTKSSLQLKPDGGKKLLALADSKAEAGKKEAAANPELSAAEEHEKLFTESRFPSAATCRT